MEHSFSVGSATSSWTFNSKPGILKRFPKTISAVVLVAMIIGLFNSIGYLKSDQSTLIYLFIFGGLICLGFLADVLFSTVLSRVEFSDLDQKIYVMKRKAFGEKITEVPYQQFQVESYQGNMHTNYKGIILNLYNKNKLIASLYQEDYGREKLRSFERFVRTKVQLQA